MKKYISILLSLFFLLMFSCKKEETNVLNKPSKKFTVTSEISGIKDSVSIVLYQLKLDSKTRLDSIVSKDGFFKFTIPSDTSYQKYEIRLLKPVTKKYITSFDIWSKDEDINISGTYNGKYIENLKIEGCELNNIEKQYLDVLLKYDKISTKEFDAAKTPEDRDAVFSKYIKLIHSDQVKFIYENPNNPVSLTYIFMHNHGISKDSLNLYYNKLDSKLQNSEKGKVLKELASTKKLKVGDHVQDFEAKNIHGITVKLSDFKGKIILLYFWASWCAPCKEQNKKEFIYLNKKFKNKGLVIISYSLDEKSKEKAWIKESKNNNWVNISNLKGFSDPLAAQYSIYSIPHSFLINREGVIVKSFKDYDGENNKIEKEIEKLLDQ